MHLLNRKSFHVAVISLVCLIIYSNTLQVPFYWDDAMLVESPIIKSFHFFLDPDAAQPFSWYGGFRSRFFGYLSFALNYRLGGLELTGYHLVNGAIHLLAALLLYWLVRLVLETPFFGEGRDPAGSRARAGFIALLAALLFVAHPIQTQAVTYIVQRFASLATMLYLLALCCYLKGRLALRARLPLAGGLWCAVALVSGLLALKSKEIAYTLPMMVLLFEFLFFSADWRRRGLVLVLALLPMLALAATRLSGASLDELSVSLERATRLQTEMSRWDYLATQCSVVLTYLRLLLLPVGQRLDWDYPIYYSFAQPKVFIGATLLALLFALGLLCLRQSADPDDDRARPKRLIALGIFWFFLALSVESSLIPIVDVIFEHRVYLPSAGLFLAVAAALSLFGGRSSVPGWPSWRIGAGALLVVLVFSGATYARNRLWGDPVAFWRDNALKSPQKSRVLVSLARALEQKGDDAGAREVYLAAVELDPQQTDSLLNLGLMDIRQGRPDRALVQFQAALARDPGLFEAHNNIGKVYGMQQRYEEALKEFQRALELRPTQAEPYNNLGLVYAQQKRYQEALKQYEKCLSLKPDYDLAYLNRGQALLALGRKSEAQADFRRALELNPGNAAVVRGLMTDDGRRTTE